MIRQATVQDLKTGTINRSHGHIVVTMRWYPRGLRKELRDEYVCDMAPDAKLLGELMEAKRRTGDHDGAFPKVKFEERYEFDDLVLEHLARLSTLSRTREVYLVCSCPEGHRCHREILMLVAEAWFGAKITRPANDYPVIEKRLKKERPAHLAQYLPAVRPAIRTRTRKGPRKKPSGLVRGPLVS